MEKLKDIRVFVLDVDGVLTDGSLLITEDGQMLRSMNVKDGLAMRRAIKAGYQILIITGGTSEGVKNRLNKLGIEEVYLGIHRKKEVLSRLIEKYDLNAEQIAYVADDIPDIEAMSMVGFRVCPADAVPDVKSVCHYISPYAGGKGCVRDLIEKTLKIQGKWHLD